MAVEVTWYGHAAFRLQPERGPSVITDPYTPENVGYPPIRDGADLVITSSDDDTSHCRADLIPGEPPALNALDAAKNGGTREVAGLEVAAIPAMEWEHHPEHDQPGQNAMYRFTLDGIRFAHMGDIGNSMTPAQIDFLRNVDVLLALTGGYLTITLPDLIPVLREVRPRTVIPMHFRTLTYKPRNTLWIESFLEHFEDSEVDFACDHRVTLRPEALPDEMRVLVMDYAR